MRTERLLAALGYDPAVVAVLPEPLRGRMRGAAGAWLVGCVAIGAIAGYAARLVEPWLWLQVLVAIGVALLAVNLLRVTTAGGGVTAFGAEKELEHWKPGTAPALVLGVVTALFAQPAQLPLWGEELTSLVDQHRQEVVAEQAVAAAAIGRQDALAHYDAHLAATDFPALRIQLMWRRPWQAARFTALFCLVVLVPVVWSRFLAASALRAYERERARRVRERVTELARDTQSRVAQLLSVWPTFEADRVAHADRLGHRVPAPLFASIPAAARKRWLTRGDP